jgi:hypothetical protein
MLFSGAGSFASVLGRSLVRSTDGLSGGMIVPFLATWKSTTLRHRADLYRTAGNLVRRHQTAETRRFRNQCRMGAL